MTNAKDYPQFHEPGHDLNLEHEDATLRTLHRFIKIAVKILAALMVFVNLWGIGDVLKVMH